MNQIAFLDYDDENYINNIPAIMMSLFMLSDDN